MKDILILLKSIIFHKEKRLLISELFNFIERIMRIYKRKNNIKYSDINSVRDLTCELSVFSSFLTNHRTPLMSERFYNILLSRSMYLPFATKRKEMILWISPEDFTIYQDINKLLMIHVCDNKRRDPHIYIIKGSTMSISKKEFREYKEFILENINILKEVYYFKHDDPYKYIDCLKMKEEYKDE